MPLGQIGKLVWGLVIYLLESTQFGLGGSLHE